MISPDLRRVSPRETSLVSSTVPTLSDDWETVQATLARPLTANAA